MLTVRNLIACVVIPVGLVVLLQRHPTWLGDALALLPTDHAPRFR